ncbi:MAG: nuclear transport factor 2 family protein [Desulfobacterales bacterium]|nr:nuclear transport factor 2 family protein [Desulfobacterales bacterium]
MTDAEIIKKYHAAWSSRNGSALVALMAPDAVFYDIPYGLTLRANEMKSYLHSLYDVCPDLKFLHIESAFCSKGLLLLRWELVLDNKAGKGSGLCLPGVEVIHVRHGKIFQVECYYDANTENKLIYSKAPVTASKITDTKPKYINPNVA